MGTAQYQNMNNEDLMRMLVEKFKIVVPAQRRTVTQAEMRLSSTRFTFNKMTVAELGYPRYVCMYISNDISQIVLCPTEKSEFAVEFYRDQQEYNKPGEMVYITNKGLVQNIREVMQWTEKGTYVIPAAACLDGKALLFNLCDAFVRTKKSKKQLRRSERVIENYPSVSDVIMNFKRVALLASASSEDVCVDVDYKNIN